jgi:hypothetical protein
MCVWLLVVGVFFFFCELTVSVEKYVQLLYFNHPCALCGCVSFMYMMDKIRLADNSEPPSGINSRRGPV